MSELASAQAAVVEDGPPGERNQSRQVRSAVADIAVAILPFAIARFIGHFFDFLYLGPIAIVVCVLVATGLLRARDRRWSDVGLTRPTSRLRVFLGALATFAVIVVASLLLRGISLYLGLGEPRIDRLLVVREDWRVLVVFLFPLSWGTAAFGEEMLTRGFMLHRLAEALGSTRVAWALGVAAQAFLFGLAHSWQGVVGVLNVTTLGVVFGVACYLARGNLWPCIVAHGSMDFLAILAIANSS